MFRDIAYPEQLSILQAAYNEYCAQLRIDPKGAEGAEIGRRVMDLYRNGCQTADCLRDGLKAYRVAS